jgi:iron-sulfur cluster protein
MPVNRKFRKQVGKALDNQPLRTALDNFARTYPQARADVYKGIDFEELREEIETIKSGAVEDIETLARRFREKVTQRGGVFHEAADGREVTRIITDIARRRNARLAVKSKSMATEEIHLNQHLEDVLKVVETDLGEWIIQQIGERPSHMVMPAIHLSRDQCAAIFSKVKGYPVEPDIPRMVKLARDILRTEFLKADIGISGCNIAAADTGTMVLFTNEGNGRLTSTLPPVHVVIMGYEKLVPRFRDIAPLAAAIPRNATCQHLTSYVTMISGPSKTFKSPGDDTIVDKELHVILLDNGRMDFLKDPVFKKVGQCIRCASCLNVCPVFGLVGGQVYGDVYTGGIGALLTAFVNSPEDAEKIQELCLNCGMCREVCPGKVDIPALILELRAHIRKKIPPPFIQRMILNNVLPHKKLFNVSVKAAAPGARFFNQFPNPVFRSFRSVFKGMKQDIKDQKGTIAFFHGCMIDYVYPGIGEAVVLLLNRAGYRVDLPLQGCCGAPALYMGLEDSAAKMAAANLEHLADDSYDYIVTACPTGTVMLKKTGTAAHRTFDFIQLFYQLTREDLSYKDKKQDTEVVVTYHYSCHLKRSSGVDKEPREVLSAVPGVKWVEMDEADRCCGFAGSYSIKLPEISSELLKRKIENIQKSGAEIVLTDCPGCLLSLRRGLEAVQSKIKAYHSAEFLALREAGLRSRPVSG